MTTWTVQLSTLESRAAEHDRFSSDLLSNLAEPLKQLTLRCEDLRKQHAEYAARLEKERDATYVELKKSKSKYDASCSDVESRRKKIESSFDHSKPKAQSAFMQQQSEMHNTKVSCLYIHDLFKPINYFIRIYISSVSTSLISTKNGITMDTFRMY